MHTVIIILEIIGAVIAVAVVGIVGVCAYALSESDNPFQ